MSLLTNRYNVAHQTKQIATIVVGLFFVNAVAVGEIIVDPDDSGATDIVYADDSGFGLTLRNPVQPPLDLGDDELYVGNISAGELLIQSGSSLTTPEASIGNHASGVGRVTIRGADAVWQNRDAITVGNRGDGLLRVEQGGSVSNLGEHALGLLIGQKENSNGAVVIDGINSEVGVSFVEVANGANSGGSLSVSNGARLTSRHPSLGFIKVRGNGTFDVAGVDSQVTGFRIDVSRGNHDAVANFSDGARIESGELRIGHSGIGTVNVRDNGSLVANSGRIELGSSFASGARGTLNIANGGVVNTLQMFVNETGEIPTGEVRISEGAMLHVEDRLILDGVMAFAGGTLSLGGDRDYDGSNSNEDVNAIMWPRAGRLSTGEQLKIGGTLNLLAPVTIDGGSLSVGSLSNADALDFQRGAFELSRQDVNVSGSGSFWDTLALGNGMSVSVAQAMNVTGEGRLELNGGQLNAGRLQNGGLIHGHGKIVGEFINMPNGEIVPRSGQRLELEGSSLVNQGTVNMFGGSELRFNSPFINEETGILRGRGTIVATEGLTNRGGMLFESGSSEIFGSTEVTESGSIEVSQNVETTFFDAVHTSGHINAESGGQLLFLDNLELLETSTLQFGISNVTRFGRVEVAEELSLAGALQVDPDGFMPTNDEFFTIMQSDSLSGFFSNVSSGERLTTLDGDGSFLVSYGIGSDFAPNQIVLSNYVSGTQTLVGDFNGNGSLDPADIDLLSAAVGSNDLVFDLTSDGSVSADDRTAWIEDIANTYFGDSNLDGEFNSGDFVQVFTRGEYEDGIVGNSDWADGDWNGDDEFDSSDFVTAFTSGGYEMGPRAVFAAAARRVAAVPEPTSGLLAVGLIGMATFLRRA